VQSSARLKSDQEPETEKPKMRYPHSVRFVTHEKVAAAEALGYEWTSALTDTHHGEHAVLMVWPHDTEPPNV
jgi:hypothetical protein